MVKKIGVFLFFLVCGNVQANEEKKLPTIELGVGFGGQVLNDYRGSKESQTRVLPLPFVIYRGNFLKADRGGVRTELFSTDRFELNISAAVALNGGSGDNELRQGMPELGSMFEIGPSLNVNLSGEDFKQGWVLRFPVRVAYSAGGDGDGPQGYLFNPKLTYIKPNFYGGWKARVNFAGLYGSEKFHDYYYTIDSPFVTEERPYYKAKSGFSGIYGKIALTKRSNKWSYGFSLRYDYLKGATFADSPLVETDQYYALSFGIARILWQSNY